MAFVRINGVSTPFFNDDLKAVLIRGIKGLVIFIEADNYTPSPGEIRFDMFECEYTHEGDRCTFEVMIRRLGLQERGLAALADVIHDIDLKDTRYHRPETQGLEALLTGLAASQPDG
jgi:hypothetical protein